MKIILKNKILLPDAPESLTQELLRIFTIKNPKWIENNQRGRWNKGVPENLKFCSETIKGLLLPRGYMRQLINACNRHGIDFEIVDQRPGFPETSFTFIGALKPFQQTACDVMIKKQFGVLTAPTGSGKTVMGIHLIASRKVPTLVLVHTKDLAYQWIDRIESFLGIPAGEVGMIGNGKNIIGEKITVAMVQSLYKRTEEVAPRIGFLVVDECHRTPSRTFHEAVAAFDSFYMMGLSATPWRRDDLSKLIFWHLGDEIHRVDKNLLVNRGDILRAKVIFRETEFKARLDPSLHYSKVMTELVNDKQRNALIASDVAKEAEKGEGICLVLSDRKCHCGTLHALLKYNHGVEARLLTGDLSLKERQAVLHELKEGRVKVLVATSQLLGEGFDERNLSVLFLSTPIKFSGRLLQYLGRILRPAEGKKDALVYDYVDVNVGVLEAAARSRQYVYNN